MKTRRSIFSAFSSLLESESYDKITVQQIIGKADVGRSTFYAHFETKDDLLREFCGEIFEHVFSDNPGQERTHDFSEVHDLRARITHLLYHIRDERTDFINLLSCRDNIIFKRYFGQYLAMLFEDYPESNMPDVPHDLVTDFLITGFTEVVGWWAARGMEDTPERVALYCCSLLRVG